MPENFESKPPIPISPEVQKQPEGEAFLTPEQQEKEAKDALESEELKHKVISSLKTMNVGGMIGSLRKRADLQERVLSDGEVKELVYDRYQWLLSRGNESQAKELEAFLRLTPEERLEIDAGELVSYLQSKKFNPDTLKDHNISEAEKNHPEVQSQAAEVAKEYIRKNQFGAAQKTEQIFNLPKEIIIDALLAGKIIKPWDKWEKVADFKEKFSLPDSFTQRVVRDRALSRWNLDGIITELERSPDIQNLLADEQVSQKISQATTSAISSADFEKVKTLLDTFDLPETLRDDIDNSSKIPKDKLVKFIRYLGADSEPSALFPKTMQKVREMVSENIATNLDLADYFIENLGAYYSEPWAEECVKKAIGHYSVASKVLHSGSLEWASAPWFEEIKGKAKTTVEENSGHGTEKFKEKDPYEYDPSRFDARKAHVSSALSEIMRGQADPEKLKELGINNKEIPPLLEKINRRIDELYKDFLETIRSSQDVREEDKQNLLNPDSGSVKMSSLQENVRSFVARFITQKYYDGYSGFNATIGNRKWLDNVDRESGNKENYEEALINEIDSLVREGFSKYLKIHEVDIPLYDKLYEEFDNLRETGRYPLEVYLGRDGIYAYIGRRAQDVARRRKMGLEGRKKLKEMGEVVEINPQYTVYPRYFRDNLDYQTKRQFLEQEGITPNADPLFYDTGYTGTIPEQIMRVMDFDDEDIERRIRLLSAPSVHRRVKGIPENAREEIIEYIEHNAKLEESAEGLVIDEKTGKIRHIAKPTSPEEQFYFMMVKQAVARHYWLQEQLHHEPSGNVNLDSEHYTIRIRQEYAKLLPDEFIENPKEFLAQHGELLKGSKGEGEYPDEEVVLFRLSDGTEIVAKKIELRKAKEARKEFSILIAAKKANLPTAEPVGFLSGKEETNGSYLLMKKLEGRSGRKFEKELKASGKYSDEEIKNILKQVSDKHKEMVELFRTTLKIDKRWRIKDTIIEFNEETGEVESVIPIDWERAQNYNPSTLKEIDEIE